MTEFNRKAIGAAKRKLHAADESVAAAEAALVSAREKRDRAIYGALQAGMSMRETAAELDITLGRVQQVAVKIGRELERTS